MTREAVAALIVVVAVRRTSCALGCGCAPVMNDGRPLDVVRVAGCCRGG